MNREEKFINYLVGLKHEGNAELLENITSGFKTLVEYRIDGSASDRVVDIMESGDEDDIDSDLDIDIIGPVEDESPVIDPVDDVDPVDDIDSELESDVVEDVVEDIDPVKDDVSDPVCLTPELLRSVDSDVDARIRDISQVIDRQLELDSSQKDKYLTNMRSQLWREMLISSGIRLDQVNGLIPSMDESLEDANKLLLDFIDTAFMIFSIDKVE